MLFSNTDSQSVRVIIDKESGSLREFEDSFCETFKTNLSRFLACEELANWIVADAQRFVAIYLILACYKHEEAEDHPFIMNLLSVSEKTVEPLERQMIYDCLVRQEIDKHSEFEIEHFREAVQAIGCVQQEPEVEQLRERTQRKYFQTEGPSSLQNIPNQDTDAVDFLTPIPDFIKISNSEFHWLSPGIICDIEWDNSAEVEKKLEKVRKIFFTALDRPLEPQERSEILNLIDTDPNCTVQLGLKREYLKSLVNCNPHVASSLVIKLAKSPTFRQYMQEFLLLPTTVLLFDAMGRIIKEVRLPKDYMVFFTSHHAKKIMKSKQDFDVKKSVAVTLGAFIRCMIENEMFDRDDVRKQVEELLDYFGSALNFVHLKMLLEK